jgi:hypothetical protein
VQTRHAEWRRHPALRNRAYAVTLNFALPGLMSLLSLIDPGSKTEWRVSFAVVAIFGALVILALARWGQVQGRSNLPAVLLVAVAVVTYTLIAVVAIAPGVVSDLSVSLTPLRCEALLLSVLIFLGVNVAWLLMFDETGS